jgi:chaperonin cofactor prefoldin
MSQSTSSRFGIAEWFGRHVQGLSDNERTKFAQEAKKSSPSLPCIPRTRRTQDGDVQLCTKEGGVCSIRLYDLIEKGIEGEPKNPETTVATPIESPVVTLCPHRFKEDDKIYQWCGDIVLDSEDAELVEEVPFLERDRHPNYYNVWRAADADMQENGDDEVGRIDGILVSATVDSEEIDHDLNLLIDVHDWCGLEIQSVYFSGSKMSLEYEPFKKVSAPEVPFPKGRRRPDFRSSSAKRLLPQLQTKIPSLRRWGKKMAVVVDEAFFYEMAEMDTVDHLSNCDIVWIVTGYERVGQELHIRKKTVQFTTLEDAVVGLTAGKPVAQRRFEEQITKKLKAPYIEGHIGALDERLEHLMRQRKELQDAIRKYIDEMKEIRNNRAKQNRLLRSTGKEAKKAQLQRNIEDLDHQLDTLWRRRAPLEEEENRLKEKCKVIRDVRARLNKEIS